MTRRRPDSRHLLVFAIAASSVAVAGAAGCRRSGEDAGGGAGAGGKGVDAAELLPPEHLAPGELVEGNESAFGVKLPRDVTVERRFGDVVYGTTNASVQALTTYFQKRVRDGKLVSSPNMAAIQEADVPGQPGLKVEVRLTYAERLVVTTVEIRNVTRPPDTLPHDEAARWRAAGMTPDGKPLDPTHLQ